MHIEEYEIGSITELCVLPNQYNKQVRVTCCLSHFDLLVVKITINKGECILTNKKESMNKHVEADQVSRKDGASSGSAPQKQQESSISDKPRDVKIPGKQSSNNTGNTSSVRSREKPGKPTVTDKSRTSKR